MHLAQVIGNVVATRKHPQLVGHRLILVQPLTATGKPSGKKQVVTDSIGVGAGEKVSIVLGREASMATGDTDCPIDACVVGVVDDVNLEERR